MCFLSCLRQRWSRGHLLFLLFFVAKKHVGNMWGQTPTEPVGASACALYATADKTARQVGGSSALHEYAVMHEDEAEAARLCAELCRLVEKV